MTTTAEQQHDEEMLRGVITKLEETRQTNMVRNAFAAWAVEFMLEQKEASGTKKKGFFGRRLSGIGRRRSSKTKKADKKTKTALQLDDDVESTEDLDRQSATNPFSGESADQDETPEDIRKLEAGSDDAEEEEGAAEEESEQTAGDTQTEGKKRIRIGGSLRTKLKARTERKTHKKADKRVDKALARAEKEKKKWLAKVEKEEEEEVAAARERKEAFMAKAALRSKDILLQHLCAIAIQSAWRGNSVRKQVKVGGEPRIPSELVSPTTVAIEAVQVQVSVSGGKSTAGKYKAKETTPSAKGPNLISPGLMQLVNQPAGSLSP